MEKGPFKIAFRTGLNVSSHGFCTAIDDGAGRTPYIYGKWVGALKCFIPFKKDLLERGLHLVFIMSLLFFYYFFLLYPACAISLPPRQRASPTKKITCFTPILQGLSRITAG
jgi:hypothetical protein